MVYLVRDLHVNERTRFVLARFYGLTTVCGTGAASRKTESCRLKAVAQPPSAVSLSLSMRNITRGPSPEREFHPEARAQIPR